MQAGTVAGGKEATMKTQVAMELARETKGAVLYKAVASGQPPVCDSLYIRKWAFPGGKYPTALLVTLEADRVPTLARAS